MQFLLSGGAESSKETRVRTSMFNTFAIRSWDGFGGVEIGGMPVFTGFGRFRNDHIGVLEIETAFQVLKRRTAE